MNREEFLKMMIESKFGNVKAFSEIVGVPYTTIRTMLANGLGKAGVDNVLKICRGLDIDPKQLSEDFEIDDISASTMAKLVSLERPRKIKVYNFTEAQLHEQNNKVVPLVGTTAANPNELSYGDINMEDSIEINVPKKAECALVVKGDSMEPEYQNGDIVFYKSQPAVENGEMAIVEIDGDGVTLKKVYYNYDDDKVVLRSLNGKYEDRELEPERVRILGKVVK
ncbi:S24 family peptidase [Enterococcus faecium]|uniref:LexA family protein n=1 Tax=Enterococcus faecium TaxID=1352 RepID=UPI0021E7023D|nr:S24 family peptidase [Enterococcus faecium]MCV3197089.1 S24 family peptidase [Enterococcus faecium]MDT2352618.1 S24 family peptidase [Enterococcus faecium]